jgi:hypothetical protein
MNLFPTYSAFHTAHLGPTVSYWCRCDQCGFEGVADYFIEDGYDRSEDTPFYRCTCGASATSRVQPTFDWMLWIVNGGEQYDALMARGEAAYAATRRRTWN